MPASLNDPAKYHDVNVNGTLNVLEAARLSDVGRVMFAASSSAYGDSDELPKRETMPPLSKSPYAANKVASEHLLRAYGTCVSELLGDATSAEALGPVIAADLTEAELRYLVRREWARTGADVVWRRSKLGLRMDRAEIAAVDAALAAMTARAEVAA